MCVWGGGGGEGGEGWCACVCVCVCVYVYQLHFHGVLGLSEMNLEVYQYTYHEASVSKLVSKYLQDRV